MKIAYDIWLKPLQYNKEEGNKVFVRVPKKELFDYVYNKYGDKCEILTGVPKPRRGITTAGDDKIKWVRRLLSNDVVVNIVWREDKPDYCMRIYRLFFFIYIFSFT